MSVEAWQRRWASGARLFRRLGLWKGMLALGVLGSLIWLGSHAAESVQRAQRAFPPESGRMVLEGLLGPVSVLRDARGIPHIEALDARDAWQALGVAHAQDRLAQMLWLRRLARGQTAEVVGEEGLPADRLARTLGLGRLADRSFGRLAPASQALLRAYAAGVNAHIASLRAGHLDPPLSLLGPVDQVSNWEPADSMAVLKLVSWSSGNLLETGLVLDDLIRVLGGALAAPFRPGQAGQLGDVSGDRMGFPPSDGGGADVPGGVSVGSRELVRSTRIAGGTAWVLAGRLTESGAPMLVADLQLPATAPALVYEAHLRSPDLNVVGATIPGLPVFWVGRNLELAWAAIPAGAVTVDLYTETVRESAGTYHDGSRWTPLEVRQEKIRIRQASGFREEEIQIRSTRHGPLVEGLLNRAGPEGGAANEPPGAAAASPVSLAWTGQRAGDGLSALLAVARAPDAGALRRALAGHHEPVVAVVYADSAGDAGVQLAGWVPERTLPSSLVPVPGRMRIYDWRGPIAFGRLPSIRFDASNSPGAPGDPQWVVFSDGVIEDGLNTSGIEWLWRPGDRTRRLERSLAKWAEGQAPVGSGVAARRKRVDLRSAAALQGDLGASDADEVVPALLRLARSGGPLSPEAEEIADLLSRWDGNLALDSSGAAAYSVLNRKLFSAFFRPAMGETLFRRYLALPDVRPRSLVKRVLLAADRQRSSTGWADRSRVVQALRESLRQTWVTLVHRLGPSRQDWTWGALHELEFAPFLGIEPAPGSEGGLAPFGVGGDASTLASSTSAQEGFGVTSASSYRIAVDLAAPDRLLSSLAPGQSEHWRHPHFSDGTARWREARPNLLLTSRLYVEEQSQAPLLLEPAP